MSRAIEVHGKSVPARGLVGWKYLSPIASRGRCCWELLTPSLCDSIPDPGVSRSGARLSGAAEHDYGFCIRIVCHSLAVEPPPGGLDSLSAESTTDPIDDDTALLFGRGSIFEGEVLEKLGDEPKALRSHEKAAAMFESRPLANKAAMKSLCAVTCAKVAGALARLGLLDRAHQTYSKALTSSPLGRHQRRRPYRISTCSWIFTPVWGTSSQCRPAQEAFEGGQERRHAVAIKRA